MNESVPWLLIGNSKHKRCILFLEALKQLSPQASVIVIDWHDYLSGKISLESFPDRPFWVRIETPAQDFLTEKEILRLGKTVGDVPLSQIASLEYTRGEILFPRQWFAGFTCLCVRLKEIYDQKKSWRWMNTPDEILLFFDKRQNHAFWGAQHIPVARPLIAENGEALFDTMRTQNLKQVFVKLAYGSSASGIVSLFHGTRGFYGITTVVHQQGRYFNSRRLQKLVGAPLLHTINYLFQQGVHLEEGIPKATLNGIPYDLRLLLIGGSVAHRIVRQSYAPMTNLHLGGKKTDFAILEPLLPQHRLQEMMKDCQRVARLHQSFYLGLDLLFSKDHQSYHFLEGNIFGDLLPGLLYEGHSTYHLEILRWIHSNDTNTLDS